MKTDYRTTIHRDGTVTFWSVYDQGWVLHVPASWVSADVLATLPDADRKRIARAVLREAPRGVSVDEFTRAGEVRGYW